MIPEGRWKARAVEAALGFTSNDNEQVAVDLVFSPDQDEDVDGRHITWYGQFTEKTEEHTLRALRTLGWTGTDFSDLTGIDTNEVELVIVHEPDLQGVPRARVRFVNAVGRGGIAMKSRMTPEQAKVFAERMRGKAMASARVAPPPPPPPAAAPAAAPPARSRSRKPAAAPATQPSAAPMSDDDIPF